ncbi:hypothetical protein Ae201684P_011350 [Aphanomyces euteiches]|uniref:MYND-type domain-containing protein n=1 Tax=Aphanomyces euteiches TaxID=100861 RepID=A0A6G0XXK7_9STRA|nr:hypothetical protein Ae201684_000484 [Aphanomyces euteiches]KAH9091806.1 hypothetical protein Ae201684P_011350 [Aphanomyces euteiches]KAH9153060.1 hypothetical protein AeRB84_004622 [Aphanomyces euteiches]
MRLRDECAVCRRKTQEDAEPLIPCSRCHLVHYCGRQHRTDHYATHKGRCWSVQRATCVAAHEKAALIAVHGLEFFSTGQFWHRYETRPYMLALAMQVDALDAIGTRISLRRALDVLFECFRLNRADNMGLRDVAPGILLRLHEDQQAYDFARWWAQDRPHYEWDNMALPYLNTSNADATESPENSNFMSAYGGPSLHHLVAVVLVKCRVLADARSRRRWLAFLHVAHRSSLRGHVPVLRLIHAFIAQPSSATPRLQWNAHLASALDHLDALLVDQIARLLQHTERRNLRIWKALLNPAPMLAMVDPPSECFSIGDENEVKKAVQRFLPAWRATPEAFERLVAHVGSPMPPYETFRVGFRHT